MRYSSARREATEPPQPTLEQRRAFKALVDNARFQTFGNSVWMDASVMLGPPSPAQRELARRISELAEAGRAGA